MGRKKGSLGTKCGDVVHNDISSQLAVVRGIERVDAKRVARQQEHVDGWSNIITGMGNPGSDRKESTTFAGEFRMPETLQRNLYTYSGLCKTIADSVVDDATRKWFTIDGDTDNKIKNECKRLSVKQELSRAWRWSRVYGGSIAVLMINDGRRLNEPLDPNNIRNIEKIKVYHRWRVARNTYYLDPKDPRYSETETFLVSPVQPMTSSFIVHESRCLIFDGVDVAPEIRVGNQWWGDSVYQAIWQRLRGLGESYSNIEQIIGEFLLMITKIKGLSTKIAENKSNDVTTRMQIVNMTRSLMGSYLLDADGEDATRVSANVAGLGELIEKMMMAVSAETRIPIRKLFGTPIGGAGLSNAGDEETRHYYDFCVSERDTHFQLPAERLVKLLMLQKDGEFKGKEISNWALNWPPLYEEPLSVQIGNKKTQAEIDTAYWEMGFPTIDILKSRFGGDSYSFETKLQSKIEEEKGIDNQGNLTRGE